MKLLLVGDAGYKRIVLANIVDENLPAEETNSYNGRVLWMRSHARYASRGINANVGFGGIELDSVDVPRAQGGLVLANRLMIVSAIATEHRRTARVPINRGYLKLNPKFLPVNLSSTVESSGLRKKTNFFLLDQQLMCQSVD